MEKIIDDEMILEKVEEEQMENKGTSSVMETNVDIPGPSSAIDDEDLPKKLKGKEQLKKRDVKRKTETIKKKIDELYEGNNITTVFLTYQNGGINGYGQGPLKRLLQDKDVMERLMKYVSEGNDQTQEEEEEENEEHLYNAPFQIPDDWICKTAKKKRNLISQIIKTELGLQPECRLNWERIKTSEVRDWWPKDIQMRYLCNTSEKEYNDIIQAYLNKIGKELKDECNSSCSSLIKGEIEVDSSIGENVKFVTYAVDPPTEENGRFVIRNHLNRHFMVSAGGGDLIKAASYALFSNTDYWPIIRVAVVLFKFFVDDKEEIRKELSSPVDWNRSIIAFTKVVDIFRRQHKTAGWTVIEQEYGTVLGAIGVGVFLDALSSIFQRRVVFLDGSHTEVFGEGPDLVFGYISETPRIYPLIKLDPMLALEPCFGNPVCVGGKSEVMRCCHCQMMYHTRCVSGVDTCGCDTIKVIIDSIHTMLNDDDIFKARIKIVEESLKSENGLFQRQLMINMKLPNSSPEASLLDKVPSTIRDQVKELFRKYLFPRIETLNLTQCKGKDWVNRVLSEVLSVIMAYNSSPEESRKINMKRAEDFF